MKKSLLFGAALAIAFAGNAKQATHKVAQSANVVASEVKACDKFTNVEMVSADRELTREQAVAIKKSIKATTDLPTAYYTRPAGTLYVGLSQGTYKLNHSFLSVAPYAEYQWTKGSVGDTYSLWEYCTGIDFAAGKYTYAKSQDNQITTPGYAGGYDFPAPYLLARNEAGDSIYTIADYVDTTPSIYLEDNDQTFYDTNLRPDADIIAYLGSTAFNKPSISGPRLDSYYSFSDKGYSNVTLKGVAELYRKPAKPYLLSGICAHFCDTETGKTPGNVKATIYPVTLSEDDQVETVGEPLYEGVGDSQTLFASGRQWQSVLWENVTVKDPVTGRPTDFIVDQDILVVVEPTDEATKFAQYLYASQKAFLYENIEATGWEDVCSYLVIDADSPSGSTKRFTLPYAGVYNMSKDEAVKIPGALKSFPIQILAENYYLYCADTEFMAASDVESSKTFAIDSYVGYEDWNVYAADSNGDEVDWIEFGAEDVMDEKDSFTGIVNATFTVAPLPEGVTGRSADVELSYANAVLKLWIGQGEAGVKDVTVKSAQSVNVVGDNFVVKASSDVTKAEVFTAAGVKVAEAAVSGTANIDASGLAHGVYFVKLNNGKTLKVVK